MTIWEFGLESGILDKVISGRKTIEGRLNKGKFANMQPGDQVELRRDYRDKQGVLQDGEPNQARVEITAVRKYASFLDMLTAEGYQRAIPDATSLEEAAAAYDRFYSPKEQAEYGVLAIEVRLISHQ